nr:reverse transcriptase domain-containing protein [Tanacetum cinerariifolium]
MQTRSSSRLASDQISNPTSSTNLNPKGRNRRRSKQRIENSNLEEHSHPVVTMADQCTMAELLRAPIEGYAETIMVPLILPEQFELKHSLINMMTTDQFFGLEKDNPHDHIRWFNKITSTIKYKDVPSSAIKLMLFPFSLAETSRRWLEKEPRRLIHPWEDLVSKFINEFFPPQEQQISVMKSRIFNNGLMNLFMKLGIDTKISFVGAHPYYQCLAAGGNTFPELRDNIQGYVSAAAVNYNQGNPGYRPPGFNYGNEQSYQAPAPQNQNVHLNELEKVKRMNEANMKAMQTQIDMVKNELRNEMKSSIQTSLSNQTNEIKNMMASLLQMNTASASGSGSLPSNTIANPKGELKAITTRSEETFTDPDLAEYTTKVPPLPAQKYKPPSQREYVVHRRDPLHPNTPYPSSEDFLEDLVPNQPSGNLTFLLHHELTSPKVNNDIFDSERCNVLSEKWLDLDSTKDLHPPLHDNPLSGITTYFSNQLLEEFADELPPKYDDNLQFDIEFDLKEIEFLLYQDKDSNIKDLIDQKDLANLADIFVDPIPKMFTDEHALDYSSPSIFNEYDDDLEVESDAGNVYDDPFDSKGEKIK